MAACMLGGAIIWGIVTQSILQGVLGAAGVLVALYFVLNQLNSYERAEIKRQKKNRRKRGNR